MDLNHLNLRVIDPQQSRGFYERWFGFREKFCEDGAVFLTNDERFLLALFPSDSRVQMPPGFHFGFLLDDPAAVRSMHATMTDGGGAPGDLEDFDGYVTFRCWDHDGHEVEVFWQT